MLGHSNIMMARAKTRAGLECWCFYTNMDIGDSNIMMARAKTRAIMI
jgi:hypothetical protein